MLFWVVAAILTLGASLSVLLPLARRGANGPADAEHDLEVYRDQLAELERDEKRGLIKAAEAEQARAEIARRILKTDKSLRTGSRSAASESKALRSFAVASVLAVPLLSWGIYAVTGSPDLPSQPLAERLQKSPANSSVDELIARAETHLAANPDDPRGWDVLAPIYVRLGRYPEAVTAYRNAIRLDQSTAQREAGLGESIAGAAGGTVTAEAQAALLRALALNPAEPKARFLLGSALAQEGKVAEAVDAWRRMLLELPADSSWRAPLQQALDEGERRLAQDAGTTQPGSVEAASGLSGPTQDDIEAAASMSDEDRSAMVDGMVANLDARLRESPDDVDGWTRLVRAYVVMGRKAEAEDALKRGMQALGETSATARQLAVSSAGLGLSVAE